MRERNGREGWLDGAQWMECCGQTPTTSLSPSPQKASHQSRQLARKQVTGHAVQQLDGLPPPGGVADLVGQVLSVRVEREGEDGWMGVSEVRAGPLLSLGGADLKKKQRGRKGAAR